MKLWPVAKSVGDTTWLLAIWQDCRSLAGARNARLAGLERVYRALDAPSLIPLDW